MSVFKNSVIGALVSVRMETDAVSCDTELTLNYTDFKNHTVAKYGIASCDIYAGKERLKEASKEDGALLLLFVGAGVVLTEEDKQEKDKADIPFRLVLMDTHKNHIILYDTYGSLNGLISNFGMRHGGYMLAKKKTMHP